MNFFQSLAVVGIVAAAVVSVPTRGVDALPRVPCAVYGNTDCANPLDEGVVDGQWIVLISHFDGTNGGPDELLPLAIGVGGNGLLTIGLTPIKPGGPYGDRMSVVFRRGKLLVSNAIYLPGQAHCCNTHRTVRQFGFHSKKLMRQREATVPNAATAAQVDAALGL